MALLTISGEPASRWEEIAQGAARLLAFDLVTETRLTHWLTEEFGETDIPSRAWRFAALSVLARMATEHHLLIAIDGGEHFFQSTPLLLRLRITATEARRAGNLMLDQRIEKDEAMARLRVLDLEQKQVRAARFGRPGSRDGFDVTLSTTDVDSSQATEMVAALAGSARLAQHGFLSPAAADELQFETRLHLARHGMAPATRASVKRAQFNHPSEEMFGNLLDFYRIPWEYEPRSFPLQWDKDGNVTEAFTPDFYLPDFDLYVELTTMKQSLVTKKNRKVKLLRAIYPHINIQVFYQKDFQDLVFKYGLKTLAS